MEQPITAQKLQSNWLSRAPNDDAELVTIVMTALIAMITTFYFFDWFGAHAWIEATPNEVFKDHRYYKAWTTLFAHADIGHIFSNILLFVPLSYYLYGYYGGILFPLVGIIMGGLINFWVLRGLPDDTVLVGISGVVYWMGAAWMTLFLLIERRQSLRRRIGKVLMISAALFFPQTFRPEVSYTSHFLGFIMGIATGLIYYAIHRKQIHAADVYVTIEEQIDLDFESSAHLTEMPPAQD